MKKLKVLVVGEGGREDALVALISRSPLVSQVWCAPGSDRIARRPKTHCLSKLMAEKILDSAYFAKENNIDLTVVGPEGPLVNGIVDIFESFGLKIAGPNEAASQLEGSKVFAKKFMKKYGIPTADFEVFDDPEIAQKYAIANLPCVIKAKGLAAGKGVFICKTKEEVANAIQQIMIDKKFKEFGDQGDQVVVEELLVGEEATFMVLTDGWTVIPLLPTQDHKPVFDNDQGPNTGGMGAYAPAPVITPKLAKEIMETIVKPTLEGMRKEGTPYKGILYVGLMITNDGPKVLEYNVRFGDPELQPLVPLLQSDIVPFLFGIANGKFPEELLKEGIKWNEGAAICVIMAAGGYPGDYQKQKGRVIKGLDEVARMEGVEVFHAGTKFKNGRWIISGGRVIGVTVVGDNIAAVIERAYHEVISKITSEGELHYRTDIGRKTLIR
jgi:phosphoribosylamine--glycine ligase